jgi:hypothetical protein
MVDLVDTMNSPEDIVSMLNKCDQVNSTGVTCVIDAVFSFKHLQPKIITSNYVLRRHWQELN